MRKKHTLKQGVASHCHLPPTLKISQHLKAVASHPGMDYGQVNGLRVSTEAPAATLTEAFTVDLGVL